MNVLDIIIIIPVIWFGFKGFKKGLIIEIASIAALVLGIYGGLHFSNFTSGIFSSFVDGKYLNIISFAVTFILIVILVHLVAKMVDKLAKAVALGIFVRIGGAVFGALKVVIIISVLFSILLQFNQKSGFINEDHFNNSLLYKPVMGISNSIFPMLENLNDKAAELIKEENNSGIDENDVI
ncbi:MAG: colicin V production protein [Marinilabiliales bacterium]|nr:MAG: colicin V production protein [Marinilabiliales bacterium]